MTSLYEMTRDLPPNAGKIWTPDQEALLLLLSSADFSLGDIAKTMGRTLGSILARYCKIKGIVTDKTPDTDLIPNQLLSLGQYSLRRIYRGY